MRCNRENKEIRFRKKFQNMLLLKKEQTNDELGWV